MQTLIKFIGLVVVTQGFLYVLRPQLLKSVLNFFAQGNRIYLAAAIRIALAVLFFIGATHCRIGWLIIAIGVATLISGIMMLTLTTNQFKKILNWFQRQSFLFIRLLAVLAIVFGAIIVYAA